MMSPEQNETSREKLRSELFALSKGQAALLLGRSSEASAWLDRACRLAPENVAIKLLYASSLIGIDDVRARSQLETITSSHPAAWVALRLLASQAYRFGELDRAAKLVFKILSCSAMPADTPFWELAAKLAKVSGLPGWIGLSHEGVLSTSSPSVLSLDGAQVRTQASHDGHLFRIRLPKAWRYARTLEVTQRGCHLLGSPIDIVSHNGVQGFVELGSRGGPKQNVCVKGWAWMPGCPDVQPTIQIRSRNRRTLMRSFVADNEKYKPSNCDGVARPRGFSVDVSSFQEEGSIHVVDLFGRDLFGSPLNIAAHREFRRPAAGTAALPFEVAAAGASSLDQVDVLRCLPSKAQQRKRDRAIACPAPVNWPPPVDIIIPVFNGAEDFRACIASVRGSHATEYRLIVVDDASREDALQSALSDAADTGAVILRQKRNNGFPAAANAGFRHTLRSAGEPRDVVLLNPDTLVAVGWLDRLRSAAYRGDDVGSVTPMTNDGSIVSYPSPGLAQTVATQTATDDVARLFSEANPGITVEIPTAVGFCMYIRRDCLISTGLFREDLFAQGYAEENDWSMRASQAGWRHIVDGATFVRHTGGRSFGAARQDLLARNLVTLNHLHPSYNTKIGSFLASDPLQTIRRNVDVVRWRAATARSGSVVFITHTLGGGVERHVRARGKEIRKQGLRPIILRPPKEAIEADKYSDVCHVTEEDAEEFPNLLFRWGIDTAALLQFLRQEKPRWIEIHHFVGHDPQVLMLPGLLGLFYDVFLHDFASVCPRISMCGEKSSYCGEPADVRDCETCVTKNGNRLADDIDPASLRARTARVVAGARRVVAPTHDAARRFSRYASAARVDIQPWEDDLELSTHVRCPSQRRMGEPVRVCIVGGIGHEKGYDVLLACARDAARRRLALSFTVVGHTTNDNALIDTDRVFITGYYEEDECLKLIKAQNADIGLLPSIWPETWCYALSALWRAALWPVVFDLGGHAERIRRMKKGTLLPNDLPARRINDTLLALVYGQKTPLHPGSCPTGLSWESNQLVES